ncbi:hypothetical protein A2926_03260 [Candidatus Giovannonibacteria bacterium RIFCSPLOWO2_01_FULL_44_40]|uniref:Uncharacterized protein n=1 Tax=Candidatus Giovannonibacteria bacterium RIFCSPHIGHO2_01_FULL_45_23 TaxID=1798325 RepID=A0A1F5VF42_9BACT|nr:MAG: hypothetical protein A2834_01970 [Candidatus Giovannonibacteria bacterium RIFCSPHIGHO2_01_FULL_45_23]OGF75070.1 MAG: hypothetical protein A3C77_04075 [Candidatus Giovannonibacteria bacterium RIFCSPHIGHO2_02_FULL_45_13]OGF80182.1 MAG: hypothetical protein A2926_03260 [Candidatus Giovannonibacteria bacterium RIFCSPLOWO2_01_FULL_44_40]
MLTMNNFDYRRALKITFLAVFVLLSVGGYSALAKDTKDKSECFDYYHFQSVDIDLHASGAHYKPGDQVKFVGFLTNENNYPLVGGSLILRVSRQNAVSNIGNDIVDEWVAKTDINLAPLEKQAVEAIYTLPSGTTAGTYILASYFVTQEKFNISGLSFTDDIYGGYAVFDVEGSKEAFFRFDRAGVKVNGKSFNIFGFTDKVFPEDTEKLSIGVPLKNDGAKAISAKISYKLYYWDSADADNLIESREENIEIKSKSSKELLWDLNVKDYPVYFLKIKAVGDGQNSEVHIRLIKKGFRPRLNFVGLTKFPLDGGGAKAFLCYHNVTDGKGAAKIELTLKNGKGEVIATKSKIATTTANIKLLSDRIGKKLNKLTLSAQILNMDGEVLDKVDIKYDCSAFSRSLCSLWLNKGAYVYLWSGIALLAAAALFYIYQRFIIKKKDVIV